MTDDKLLQEQMAYYRARAAEYDEWFYRTGRYDYGEAINAQWFAEIEVVRDALRRLQPAGHVLELACGTGIWTEELVRIGTDVTAVDASAEMLAITQAKLPDASLTCIQADLFTWEPDRTYDTVCFAFWLSHVPPERLDTFLAKVARATRPGGSIFMVDSREALHSGAKMNQTVVLDDLVHERKLKDGRTFRVIKRYYQPEELQAHLAHAGFAPSVHTTHQFFIYATGHRQPGFDQNNEI
jgi:demethylmenaquinone methyltransferase/2-methoxy-6-polyprenyl-1,4-benzoquinol methylase